MHLGTVDIYAVTAASVASVIFGYLWYSKLLFRKYWLNSVCKSSKKCKRESGKPDSGTEFILSFLTSVIMATILASLLSMLQVTSMAGGIMVGLYIWAGFIVIVLGSLVFHEGRHADYFFITAGHRLIEIVMMGAIIGSMS